MELLPNPRLKASSGGIRNSAMLLGVCSVWQRTSAALHAQSGRSERLVGLSDSALLQKQLKSKTKGYLSSPCLAANRHIIRFAIDSGGHPRLRLVTELPVLRHTSLRHIFLVGHTCTKLSRQGYVTVGRDQGVSDSGWGLDP